MVIKTKIILLLFCVVPFFLYSQNCDNIKTNIIRKERNVFLLDTILRTRSQEDILSQVDPKDSALVRIILENGKSNQDYVAFFRKKGFEIKKIKWPDFDKLPKDSTVLTRKEKRILNDYELLYRKSESLLLQDKSSARLEKKLGKRKYRKVLKKEDSTYPILFAMYPIYEYLEYILTMYLMKSRNNVRPFMYEICTVSNN